MKLTQLFSCALNLLFPLCLWAGETLPRPEPMRELATERDFFVKDFGALADDDKLDGAGIQAAINAAMASGHPARVVFEAGIYRLEPRAGKAHGISIEKAKDLVLDGKGARIQITEPTIGFVSVVQSERVLLRDFDVDMEILPFSGGILTKVDVEAGVLELEIVPPHPPLDLPHFQSSQYSRWGSVLDAKAPGRLKTNTFNFFATKSIESLGGNRYRITLVPGHGGWHLRSVAVGDRFMQQTRVDAASLAQTGNSKDITYQRITSYASAGGQYVGSRNERVNILECRALVAPGRWKNGNSDGVHFQNNRVGAWVENCVFEGLSDDCVNFYLRPVFVGSGEGKTFLIVEKPGHESGHTRPAPASFFAAGEPVVFFDAVRNKVLGEGRVVSYEAGTGKLTLDSEITGVSPGTSWENTQVYNVNMSGGFVLRGNRFANSRRYGVFLKACNGLIEGNTFEGLSGPAVTMHNAPKWPEGLWCRNVIVRNNRIHDCGFGASFMEGAVAGGIAVFLEATKKNALSDVRDFHRDLVIEGNTITDWKRSAISVANTKGLRISGNRIGPPAGPVLETWKDEAVTVRSSDETKIEGNLFE